MNVELVIVTTIAGICLKNHIIGFWHKISMNNLIIIRQSSRELHCKLKDNELFIFTKRIDGTYIARYHTKDKNEIYTLFANGRKLIYKTGQTLQNTQCQVQQIPFNPVQNRSEIIICNIFELIEFLKPVIINITHKLYQKIKPVIINIIHKLYQNIKPDIDMILHNLQNIKTSICQKFQSNKTYKTYIQEECPICLIDTLVTSVGHCGHMICSECAAQMIEINRDPPCPICRGPTLLSPIVISNL